MGTINRYRASNIKFMCPRTQKVQLFTSFRSHMDPHFGANWLQMYYFGQNGSPDMFLQCHGVSLNLFEGVALSI